MMLENFLYKPLPLDTVKLCSFFLVTRFSFVKSGLIASYAAIPKCSPK